ncbi:MAG: SRPBCC family protein [Aestuariivirga sp.]|uniref:SRPBCC family protein n=1 Tax=Aestuariivirga sp. TaxID=2650926 RepID=UPI0025B7D75F|nr:SRPBCC family protein [Aestuariivirga sp.]MCA3560955.1 SRPBCC family protein [Aestuariivirga sp.]
MKTAIIVVAGSILALGGVVLIAGLLLPRTTEANRSVVLPVPVERVFAKVADAAGQANWRSDIGRIEMASDGQNWVEQTSDGDRIAFRIEESLPNERFAISYVSARGFNGEWTGRFTPQGEGTRLEVTERVTIPNPVFRLIGRLVAPPGSHTDLYLADLGKALMPPAPGP